MADDCIELRDLNFKTFRAEEGGGGETQIDGKSAKAGKSFFKTWPASSKL
jgi:hypothetical protein